MTARIIGTRIVHKGWTTLMVATLRDAQGHEFAREIEDHGQAVGVLPYDPERRTVMLIRIARAPVLFRNSEAGDLWEAPAGMMDEDDPEDTARREALEEVGLRLGVLEHVVTAWSSPGLSTEKIALFLAPYRAADRVTEGGGLAHENEGITVAELGMDAFWRMVQSGEIDDLKTVALAQALRLRHPDLFQA